MIVHWRDECNSAADKNFQKMLAFSAAAEIGNQTRLFTTSCGCWGIARKLRVLLIPTSPRSPRTHVDTA